MVLNNIMIAFLLVDASNLKGNIITELGLLSNLQYLDLSSNHLSGTIPTELAALSHLSELNMLPMCVFVDFFTHRSWLTPFFIVATLLLLNNSLMGNLTPYFCNQKRNDFEADCSSGKVQCGCCTHCY